MPRYSQTEIDEARAKLLTWLKPGDTISTVSRHTSRSGMRRSISLFTSVDGELVELDYYASRVLGESIDQKHGGIRIGGCGMDMGHHLVYSLSRRLWPDGFGCIGRGDGEPRNHCPASDHANGDRDYTPHDPAATFDHDAIAPSEGAPRRHWHGSDGGYALRHRWI